MNEGYYDLESDICGIKRGLNLGVGNAVYINGRNIQPKKKKMRLKKIILINISNLNLIHKKILM